MLAPDTTIVSFIMRIVENYLHLLLILALLKKEVRFRNVVISSIMIATLYEGLFNIIPYNFKYIIPFTLLIPLSLIFKINVFKVLVVILFSNIIVGLIDIVITFAFIYYLQVDSLEEITNSTMFYYSGFILFFIAVLLVEKIIKLINYSIKISDEAKTIDIGIVFNYMFTFLLIFPNAFILVAYIENKPLSINNVIISLVSMVAMFILSVLNSQKRYNLILSQQEIEYQRNYNATLKSLVDGLRTFKHDYNNTLSTLYGYVQLEDMKSLKRVFKEVLDESKTLTTLDKLNPDLIKNPSIYGLMTTKYQQCEKNNVNMNIEIFSDLEELQIKTFDLTRILGIFLDNAIEAASGSKERKINILITEKNDNTIIEISNTYSDKAISVEKIYEKGESSKGKDRGLGLYKVKEIIKRSSGVQLKTVVDDEKFLQRLIIQKMTVH
jgi:two-component system sensor histidine kinase AgrC